MVGISEELQPTNTFCRCKRSGQTLLDGRCHRPSSETPFKCIGKELNVARRWLSTGILKLLLRGSAHRDRSVSAGSFLRVWSFLFSTNQEAGKPEIGVVESARVFRGFFYVLFVLLFAFSLFLYAILHSPNKQLCRVPCFFHFREVEISGGASASAGFLQSTKLELGGRLFWPFRS